MKQYIVLKKRVGEREWKEDSPWNNRSAAVNAASRLGTNYQTRIRVISSPDRPMRWNRED